MHVFILIYNILSINTYNPQKQVLWDCREHKGRESQDEKYVVRWYVFIFMEICFSQYFHPSCSPNPLPFNQVTPVIHCFSEGTLPKQKWCLAFEFQKSQNPLKKLCWVLWSSNNKCHWGKKIAVVKEDSFPRTKRLFPTFWGCGEKQRQKRD